MSSGNNLLTYRPMSQMLRLSVIPEVEKRVERGLISRDSLPLSIDRFRILNSKGTQLVEINDEVKLQVQVRAKGPVLAGQEVRLADIHPDECFIPRPAIDGNAAAYYLRVTTYLSTRVFFDFSPNNPNFEEDNEETSSMAFPLRELVAETHLLEQLAPKNAFSRIARLNWPPAPAYYPTVLQHLAETPDPASNLLGVISIVYNRAYWDEKLQFWREVGLAAKRLSYIAKVIDEYFLLDYVSTIYILVPQFEGIVRDYLTSCGIDPNYRFESCLIQLKKRAGSHSVMMFPRSVLDAILTFLESGPFLSETTTITNPSEQVNRHGIAHGNFTDFETHEIALKYLALLDALMFVLLHDRIVAGTL